MQISPFQARISGNLNNQPKTPSKISFGEMEGCEDFYRPSSRSSRPSSTDSQKRQEDIRSKYDRLRRNLADIADEAETPADIYWNEKHDLDEREARELRTLGWG